MNKPRLSNDMTNIGFLPLVPGNFMTLELVKADRTLRVDFNAQQITLIREGQRNITHGFRDGTQFWTVFRPVFS